MGRPEGCQSTGQTVHDGTGGKYGSSQILSKGQHLLTPYKGSTSYHEQASECLFLFPRRLVHGVCYF
eukprot:scaffold59092_cov50-Attheya_sp.AAC.2